MLKNFLIKHNICTTIIYISKGNRCAGDMEENKELSYQIKYSTGYREKRIRNEEKKWYQRSDSNRHGNLIPLDFESSAYTNFATLAQDKNNKTLIYKRQLK